MRIALQLLSSATAADPELVVWLIGSHHGHGRPFFPHADPDDDRPRSFAAVGVSELAKGAGPQSLAFEWRGVDWIGMADRVRRRYGPWELALMEAVLRLADHRASEVADSEVSDVGAMV